jgi:hypothetical protein
VGSKISKRRPNCTNTTQQPELLKREAVIRKALDLVGRAGPIAMAQFHNAMRGT